MPWIQWSQTEMNVLTHRMLSLVSAVVFEGMGGGGVVWQGSYIPGWTSICNVAKDDLELPASSPKCRGYRSALSHLFVSCWECSAQARQALCQVSHNPSPSMFNFQRLRK